MDDLNEHINVTLKLGSGSEAGMFDLRIPLNVTVKQLMHDISEAFAGDVDFVFQNATAVRIVNKDLVISDDQSLRECKLTNGDILEIH